MEIRTYVMGAIETNSYLLVEGKQALFIDPAGKAEKCFELLGDLELVGILLTHGHFDHIKAVDGLKEKYNCPVYLDDGDNKLAHDKNQGASFNMFIYLHCQTTSLSEGKHQIGNFNFELFKTPGHTEGSVIYKFGNDIFTGDTLFMSSVGRTDLPGGNNTKLVSSLKIFKMFPLECNIYPGHGPSSSLDIEYQYNPYL